MHFIGARLQDTLESLSATTCELTSSQHYTHASTCFNEHVFVCRIKAGKRKRRRRTRRKKKMLISGLTCQSETHVTHVRNRGVHSSAARERLSFSWHLRVELFTDWVGERKKRGEDSRCPPRVSGGDRDGESEREKERGREKLHVWVGRDVWRATVVTRCNYALLWHLRSYTHTYPAVPFFLFLFFFFYSSSFPNRVRRDEFFVKCIALCYTSSEIRLPFTPEPIFT